MEFLVGTGSAAIRARERHDRRRACFLPERIRVLDALPTNPSGFNRTDGTRSGLNEKKLGQRKVRDKTYTRSQPPAARVLPDAPSRNFFTTFACSALASSPIHFPAVGPPSSRMSSS